MKNMYRYKCTSLDTAFYFHLNRYFSKNDLSKKEDSKGNTLINDFKTDGFKASHKDLGFSIIF